MTYAERRLAELTALSRLRPLTDAEQREAMLRARQDRRNRRRRQLYAEQPERREAAQAWMRDYRKRTPGYWRERA